MLLWPRISLNVVFNVYLEVGEQHVLCRLHVGTGITTLRFQEGFFYQREFASLLACFFVVESFLYQDWGQYNTFRT